MYFQPTWTVADLKWVNGLGKRRALICGKCPGNQWRLY